MEVNTTSLLKVFIGAGVAVGLLCATAQGQPDPLISGNNMRPWDPNGAIATTKFPTPGSTVDFIPDGTKIDSNGGHGLLVLGNKVYYTELANIDGPTDKIRTAPFNGGHGGPDNGALTNPRPGCGVKELAYHDGYIYDGRFVCTSASLPESPRGYEYGVERACDH